MLSDDFVTSFGGELSPSCLSHQQIFSKLNTLLLACAGQVTLVLASSQINVWNAWCWKKFDKIFYMPVLLVVGVNFQGVIFSYFHLSKYTQLVLCSMFNLLPPLWCHMATKMWVNIGLDNACCLMVPSHYLKQYWLEIIGIWPSAILQKIHKICEQKLSFKMEF